MKSMHFNLASLRPVRLLLAVCLCASILFANAFPAFAVSSTPTKGDAEAAKTMKAVTEVSRDVAKSAPLSREQTQARANQGLNEIQADSGLEQMKNPGTSEGVPSAEESVKQKLENIVKKIPGNS